MLPRAYSIDMIVTLNNTISKTIITLGLGAFHRRCESQPWELRFKKIRNQNFSKIELQFWVKRIGTLKVTN